MLFEIKDLEQPSLLPNHGPQYIMIHNSCFIFIITINYLLSKTKAQQELVSI